MKYTKTEFIYFAMIVLFGIVAIMGIGFGSYAVNVQEENSSIYDEDPLVFDIGWVLNENEQKRVKLPCAIQADAMEVVSITSYLPESIAEGTYLRIESRKAYIQVSIDGVLIYSNGEIKLGKNKKYVMPMDRWNFIELYPDYSERKITITYQSPYSYFSGVLPTVIMGTYSEVLLYTYSQRNSYVYLGICIMAVGIMMLLISLINTMGDNTLRPGAYLGIYIVLMAVMYISQAKVPKNYIDGYYKDFMLENIALRLGIFAWAVYLYLKGRGRIKTFISILTLLISVNFPVSLFLHITGRWDFNDSLVLPMIAAILLFLLQFYVDVFSKKAGSKIYRFLMGIGIAVYGIAMFMGTGTMSGTYLKLRLFTLENDKLYPISFLIYSIFMCIGFLISSYDIAAEQVRISEELNKAKNRLMVSQIQPHFIYNTLNTIRAMTLIEPKRASEVILHFANYLRYSFRSLSGQDVVEFSEELKHIREYTSIECERFHKLKVEYEIETMNFLVPPLSIQVFVENAIKHGVGQKEEGGTVKLVSYEKEGNHIVVIKDDGVGFDPEILKRDDVKKGIGIKNAVYRLEVLTDAKIDIQSVRGKGSQIQIEFPKALEIGNKKERIKRIERQKNKRNSTMSIEEKGVRIYENHTNR